MNLMFCYYDQLYRKRAYSKSSKSENGCLRDKHFIIIIVYDIKSPKLYSSLQLTKYLI